MQITRRLEFDAGHRIPDHASQCRHLHGHRYVIEISLSGNIIDKAGDAANGMALVAVAADAGAQRIVGEIRYCAGRAADTADIAVAVDDDWQFLGVGRGLLERIEMAARQNGVHHLKGDVLAANEKMLEFARNRGFQLWPDEDDRRMFRIAKTLVG